TPARRPLVTQTPPPEISPLSLHDALPIWRARRDLAAAQQEAHVDAADVVALQQVRRVARVGIAGRDRIGVDAVGQALQHDLALRSEEHTSELQSRENLVCRLLLEKKKQS